MFDQLPNVSLQTLPHPVCKAHKVDLRVLRLDQTDAQVSGNKWYKLKYNLLTAKEQRYRSVLSFGGAYSNHIHALAWAGKQLGLKTVGVIRGEPEYAANPTLTDAQCWGMQLQFVSRGVYRQRHEQSMIIELVNSLPDELKPVMLVPEGGSNALAVKGCQELLTQSVLNDFVPELIVLPCGTGGTLAGIALSQPNTQVLGIPVLKNAAFLYEDIKHLMQSAGTDDPKNWSLDLEGHCGGYAKSNPELTVFLSQMGEDYGLPLDQVYTGKMLLRLLSLIADGQCDGKKVLAIHTGGLQGARS